MCSGVDLKSCFQVGESSRGRAHTGEGTRTLIFREVRMGPEQLGKAIHFLVVGSRGKELAEATAIEGS